MDWGTIRIDSAQFESTCNYCSEEAGETYFVYSFSNVDSVSLAGHDYEILVGNQAVADLFKVSTERIGDVLNVKTPLFYTESGQTRRVTSVTLNVYEKKSEVRIKKNATFATQSKLSSGSWYKLKIEETGVYKLDANYFSSIGIDINSINPSKIKIYGNGGAMLPQVNTEDREDDLVENHIYVSTSGSSFSSSDYVLFYAESPHKLTIDTANQVIGHDRNIYSDHSYYFLTIDGDNGLRIGNQGSVGSGTASLVESDAYAVFEGDETNALKSGRTWYWLKFENNLTQYYDVSLPGRIANSDFNYTSKVMARAFSSAVTFATNFESVSFEQTVPKNVVNTSGYGTTGYDVTNTELLNFSQIGNVDQFQVELVFSGDASSNATSGYRTSGSLDYAAVQYKQQLGGLGVQNFRNFESLNQELTQFTLAGSNTLVWDVTDHKSPIAMSLNQSGSSVSFVEGSSTLREYVAFELGNAKSPVSTVSVVNQDLHGVSVPDVVIVTNDLFASQAQELAQYREGQGYDVFVTTPELIYNEFSSGQQDISAIRDFMKMLYDRSPSKLKYLVLFGAASYDYKDRLENNTNFVPTYQSYQSLHNVETYASDDYYGFLEDGDGEWAETNSGNHDMVINVGRLPVLNTEEASSVVEKIKRYEDVSIVNGAWKNKVVLVSDDGDNNLHVRDAERLSRAIANYHPTLNLSKLPVDAFEQIPGSGADESVPGFHSAFDQFIDEGGLIVNYTGHGNPVQWGRELMMTMDKIDAMTNSDKLPIYVTATCDFGVFDNPEKKSGAMNLVSKLNGGAIAAVTTTRAVYASSNYVINEEFYRHLFTRNSDSTYYTLGEVFKLTKNNSTIDVNNRGFSLLGDPCLQMTFPDRKVKIEAFNDEGVTTDADTLKALTINRFRGKVMDAQENDLALNGILKVTVYDRPAQKVTLGSVDSPYTYEENTNLLFDGFVTVEDGEFIVEFPLSRDISYNYEQGKMIFYVYDSVMIQDAIGVYDNLVVGGTNDNPSNDDEGPLAELYLNDFSFTNGGYTQSNPLFLAKLNDDNGINISSTSIGHEITITLDNDPNTTQNLNSFYTADVDDFTSGLVQYPMSGVSEGTHTLQFIAWDTYNNPVIEELEFTVGENVVFYNYPNPFQSETRIRIEHSRAREDLQITLRFFNELGVNVFTQTYEFDESSSVIDNIIWDGSFNGEPCASGVYIIHADLYYPESGVNQTQITKTVLTH